MNRLDYVSLCLFASVLEQGNIAQAARINNIAASAVSKRIADLEQRLGVPVMRRLRDGIEATEAGRALYRHVCAMNETMRHLQADLSEFASGGRGLVRLWANPSSLIQFLPEDLRLYADRHPNVRIELREENSVRIVQAVSEGIADIGVFSGHIGAVDLETRLYRRDTMMVVVPKGHPLSDRHRVSLADTVAYDHVGLQEGSSLQHRVLESAGDAGHTIRIRVQLFSFDGVRRMVEAGLGIAIMPQGAVMPHLGDNIVALELDEPWAARRLYLAYRDLRSLPMSARELIDLLAPAG